jgi:8-oxo-(d)GTP phosphatase
VAQRVEGSGRRPPAVARVNDLVRAGGGVVLRHGTEGLEVLLVHRPAYDDWSLPKGKLEPGEDEQGAALREVEEETGLHCLLGRELGMTEYVDSRGRPKQVHYWEMAAPAGEPAPANEIDDVSWASVPDAAERLDYAHDRKLLAAVGESVRACEHVFLVRHAKAGNREKWDAPDELRPLSKPGWRQADAIASALADEGIAALVSSPYVRCVQTFEPLGTRLGLAVQEHDALAEGGSTGPALQLVRAVTALGSTALSTHGDVQPGVVYALADLGVPLEGSLDFTKGSTWVLDVREGEITAGRYVAPPA